MIRSLRLLCAAMSAVFFLVAFAPAASAADAEKEDYYWKNSYPRGAGKMPISHDCPGNRDADAGLCYDPCKSGYHGVGPICWQDSPSYGRGAGTIPPLDGCDEVGKVSQSGLCYKPCREGYHGKGPVCWRDGKDSYGRGVGKPLKSICSAGMEADAGLCYEVCKKDYTGIGPVCWGDTPPGYVDCAAAFAKDRTTCGKITTEQVAATAMFAANAALGVKATVEAAKTGWLLIQKGKGVAAKADDAEEAVKQADKVYDALKPALTKVKAALKDMKSSKPATTVKRIKQAFKDIPEADKIKIKLAIKVVGMVKANDQDISEIDLLRNAASLASVIDKSGALSVVAAYSYPVYGEEY